MPRNLALRALAKLAALPVVCLWATFLVTGGGAGPDDARRLASPAPVTGELLVAQSASTALGASLRADAQGGPARLGRGREGGTKTDVLKRGGGLGPCALGAAAPRLVAPSASVAGRPRPRSVLAPVALLDSPRTSRGPPASPRHSTSEV